MMVGSKKDASRSGKNNALIAFSGDVGQSASAWPQHLTIIRTLSSLFMSFGAVHSGPALLEDDNDIDEAGLTGVESHRHRLLSEPMAINGVFWDRQFTPAIFRASPPPTRMFIDRRRQSF